MEDQGKNWRIAKDEPLFKKLGIPIEILIEIKMKYCSNTRKIIKAQKSKEILTQNINISKKEKFELSEEVKKYEKIYQNYIREMKTFQLLF